MTVLQRIIRKLSVPKRSHKINNFSGLNTLKTPSDLDDSEFESILEMHPSGGSLTPPQPWTGSYSLIAQNSNIVDIEPGYGLGYFENDYIKDSHGFACAPLLLSYGFNTFISGAGRSYLTCINDGTFKNNPTDVGNGLAGDPVEIAEWFPPGTKIRVYDLDQVNGGGPAAIGVEGIYNVISHTGHDEIELDGDVPLSLFWGASIEGFSDGEELTLLANPPEQKIDVHSKGGATGSFGWTSDVIVLSDYVNSNVSSKVKYYGYENAIRCCDTNLQSQCKIKWYGFIDRTHFPNTNEPHTHLGYFSNDNDLSKPTDGDVSGAVTYPTNGDGFDIAISAGSEDSTISGDVYELGSSFIYDGNQESLIYQMSGTYDHSADDLKSIEFEVTAAGTLASGYNERISGGRIYIREQGSVEEWILLADIDLSKGVRSNLSSDYEEWTMPVSGNYKSPSIEITNLNIVNYEIINGFSSSIYSHELGLLGEKWKDSVIANNRVFLCGINMKDEKTASIKADATNKYYPDMIMYSMPNRYDTFPRHNYIETAKGDADVYTAIESYADRLFAFKKNSVDIINIATPDDANWFLEESRRYMGVLHPEAVKKTQHGLLWVNSTGLYLYNGQSINNLLKDKLSPSDMETNFSSSTIALAYDELGSRVHILSSLDGSDDTVTVLDFDTGSLSRYEGTMFQDSDNTNFIDTADGNTVYGSDSVSAIDFYKSSRSDTAVSDAYFLSKVFDFGSTSLNKVFYKLVLSYICGSSISDKLSYRINGGLWNSLVGPTATSGSYVWGEWEPTTPEYFNYIQFKYDNSGSDSVYIDNISVIYRPLVQHEAY